MRHIRYLLFSVFMFIASLSFATEENAHKELIFVTSEYSCKDIELSIYKDDWEYFFKDCDALFNEDGWNYIGYFSPDFDGNIEIDSNQQILIINDDIYFDEGGFQILISLLFCCIVPSDWLSNPAITRRRVVLPHPEGPRIQTNSPSFTSKLILFRA